MAGLLKDHVAIVTGAGRGFGKAIALRFAREGAAIAVTARSRRELDETAGEIEAHGGRVLDCPADITSPTAVRHVVAQTERALGPVSLIVSNAGVPGPFGPLSAIDPDAWWQAQEVHLKGPVCLLRAALPGMIARQRGSVIFVSAIASHVTVANLSAYIIGKTAQRRLAEIVALEGKSHGVAAFAIDPGLVATRLMEDTLASPDAQKWLPGMVERLRAFRGEPDNDRDLRRCADRCVALASGRYDELSGLYCELPNDLDAMLEAKRAERKS